MTPEFHLRAKELDEDTTNGPWKQKGSYIVDEDGDELIYLGSTRPTDFHFIAESRTLIPKYIQLVELMQKQISVMREGLNKIGRIGSEDPVPIDIVTRTNAQSAAIEKEIGEI